MESAPAIMDCALRLCHQRCVKPAVLDVGSVNASWQRILRQEALFFVSVEREFLMVRFLLI